jgi:hypothetical protein
MTMTDKTCNVLFIGTNNIACSISTDSIIGEGGPTRP